MKKILTIFAFWAIFFSLFLTKQVFAQESPEEMAKKHGVTFPIAELGGCNNYSECRTFCEDPVNYTTCVDFAKKKGFYKEDATQTRKDEMLEEAKKELGCTSFESCQTFCHQEENFDKCSRFAQKHGVGGGHIQQIEEKKFLEKAKEVLGCDSPSSCMNFCDKEENRQKCGEFAKQMGFRGGEEKVGPGGCNSEETCRQFCSQTSNYTICQGFSQAHGGKFSGPGGCDSEASCRAYCEKNPQECGGVGNTQYNPQEMCRKTPNCSWIESENSCRCSSITGYPQPTGDWGGSYDKERMKSECEKTSGCSWTGDWCQCQGYQGGTPYPQSTYYPQPTYHPQPTSYYNYSSPTGVYSYPTPSYDPATECGKTPGCSWSNNQCQCQSQTTQPTAPPSTGGGTTFDPAAECAKQSGCSWNGSSCQCSGTQTGDMGGSYSYPSDSYSSPASQVQGATATNNFLTTIIESLVRLFLNKSN